MSNCLNGYFSTVFGKIMQIFYKQDFIDNNLLNIPTYYMTEILTRCDYIGLYKELSECLMTILNELFKSANPSEPTHFKDLS
jgi:hypothetical protein